MAGFFGLFDYSKAGPGISKSEPQKKGFVRFFELYFRKFWKLVTLNLIYVLISLPVVTWGLAGSGMAFVTRNFTREKHAFVYGDFVDTIRKNWKQALPVGIINLTLTGLLTFNIIFLDPMGIVSAIIALVSGQELQSADYGVMHTVMTALTLCTALIFTFMKYYIYLMLVTFKLSVKQLYKNSLIFAFAGLWRNLLIFFVMGFMYAAVIIIFLLSPAIGIIAAILGYVFFFHSFKHFLIQFVTFPMVKKLIIDPYYKEHPDEDREAKQALNLEDPDESGGDDEDKIFEDVDEDEDEEEEGNGKTRKSSFPRQYTRQEMDRLKQKQDSARRRGGSRGSGDGNGNDNDDDGTI